METMDIAAYFKMSGAKSNKHLNEWYDDKIVPHSVYRNFMKSMLGKDAARRTKSIYQTISLVSG